MSNFDDWGTGNNKDWDSSDDNSDFDFSWDPENNFEHAVPPKKSLITHVKQQSLWIKIGSGVGVAVIFIFVFIQAGGVTKLRTMGVFREPISAEGMCLNGLQVGGELVIGAFSTVVMNRAIDHADRVKSQRSGDVAVDEAAWAVADSAYILQDAVRSIPDAFSSADMMLGDILDALNSEGMRDAALAVTQASEKLGAACGQVPANAITSATGDISNREKETSEFEDGLVPSDTTLNLGEDSAETLVPEPPETTDVIVNTDQANQETIKSDEPATLIKTRGDSEITFLTFNVCHSECKNPAPSWAARRERIANVIVESGAEVVGLQEVTNWQVASSITEWNDIQNLVSADGFVGPKISEEFNECTKFRQDPCVDTARILFNSKRLTQLKSVDDLPAAGYATLGAIAPGIDLNARNRSVAWAYLMNSAGKSILTISLHMDSDKTAGAESARQDVAQRLNQWVEALNRKLRIEPSAVVLMADLNSYDARQPEGAQTVFLRDGWIDAWITPDRRNIMYSTINYTPDTQQFGGWPPRPRPFKDVATRLDYIFARGNVQVVDYEVMIWLNPDGTFDPNYQASDHQSVRATLAL